jgi:hypothetical protein
MVPVLLLLDAAWLSANRILHFLLTDCQAVLRAVAFRSNRTGCQAVLRAVAFRGKRTDCVEGSGI